MTCLYVTARWISNGRF